MAKMEREIPQNPDQETNEEISVEAIAALAHSLYVARGGTHGGDVKDWLEAERLLKQGSTGV